MNNKRTMGVVLFNDFELLDVFGPLEMFGLLKEGFDIRLVSENGDVVNSSAGPRSVSDHSFNDSEHYHILMVPGGMGARKEVENENMLGWIRNRALVADYTISICTGSALLARAGVLDGKQATTNKLAFEWASSQGKQVNWVKEARWVRDKNIFTSSGVSAGIDMSLAVIETLYNKETAKRIAALAEYNWCEDSTTDPFAAMYGL